MKELLKNEIVVNWIAPIITGLIVFLIPAAFLKFWRNRKDEKEIKSVNQRYLDAIMPFIIQKIEIKESFITDIRKGIISESNIKDKYIYSEIELRDKLILDISESKYINEINKEDLIVFTYKTFANIANEINISAKENDNSRDKKTSNLVLICSLMLILSQLLLFLTIIIDKRNIKPEDNVLLYLPMFSGLISIMGLMMAGMGVLFSSKVYRNDKINDNIYNTYDEILKKVTTFNIRKNKDGNKNKNN